MREGALWEGLQPNPGNPKALSGTTLFSRFCWTGGNSHTDRLEAGEALKERLHGLTKKFPNSRHFVVGHSHGGNVMLYAMKDKSLADRVTGLVTLATPFITVRRRKLHPLVLIGILIICLFGAVEAALQFKNSDERSRQVEITTKAATAATKAEDKAATAATEAEEAEDKAAKETTAATAAKEAETARAKKAVAVTEANRFRVGWSIGVMILLWLFGTVISAVMYRGREFGLGKLIPLLWRRDNAEDIVTGELDRLKLTPDDESARMKQLEKMLVARPIGDEAAMSLVVSQFFSWVQNRILTMLSSSVSNFWKIGWFSWIWKLMVLIVLVFVVAKVLPNTVSWFQELDQAKWVVDLFGTHWAMRGGTIFVVQGISAILVLYGLVCLIGLLVLLAAASPFGPDAMFWNHYFSTTAESSPPGTARVFLQSPPPGTGSPGLVHSGIYTDSKVIDEIVEWINSREAAHAKT
jgi:hypothetical protein